MKNRQSWIWFSVLFLIFMIISYVSFLPKPKVFPSYVTESPSPTGVKAFFTLLNKETESKRWDHSPDKLPKSATNHLLIMVEPSMLSEKKELQAYIDFMKAGNTILLLKNNPKGMFDLETEEVSAHGILKIYDQNKQKYKAEISSSVRLLPKKEDSVLLHDKSGTVALKRSFGNGQLIVAIAPDWMTNGEILDHDHLPLILYLMQENKYGTILFDEYVHGMGDSSTFWTVYPKWFLLLILQGILLMALWLWYKGKRFGPIIVPREETVRFSDEAIRALSAWLLRGARYHDSLRMQSDYVKFLLQERWRIPYSRDWKDLSGQLERKWLSAEKSEIDSFLGGLIQVLKKEKISKQEYLLWSVRLDHLRKEVERG